MLQCTHAAALSLDRVRDQQGIPGSFGIRLFPAETPEGVTLGMAFTDTPHDGDEVTEQFGERLMIAPEVADQLADLTLDVLPDPSANGGSPPQLVLRPSQA